MSKRKTTKNEILATLGTFDANYGQMLRIKWQGIPVKEVKPLTMHDYAPRGGTPLNDAVLEFIGVLDNQYSERPNDLHLGLLADESGSMGHLKKDVVDGFNEFIDNLREDVSKGEPGVLLVIMTDGGENSSVEDRDGSKVRDTIAAKELHEGWDIFYLGANQDSWATGRGLGMTQGFTMNYDHTSAGLRSATASVSNLAKERSFGKAQYAALASSVADSTANDSGGE